MICSSRSWLFLFIGYVKPFTIPISCLKFMSSSHNIVKSANPDIEISNLSLSSYILENVKDYGDKKAITCRVTGRSYKYNDLVIMTDRLAKAYLSAQGCNLKKNDAIGILLPNIPEFVPAVLGAKKAGLQVTFANPLHTPDEIRRQFEVANMKMVVTIPQLLPVSYFLQSNLPSYCGTICIGDENFEQNSKIFNFRPLVTTEHNVDLPRPKSNDIAIIPFSSGTSGLPKGVLLKNENCVVNLNQISAPNINRYISVYAHDKNENVLTIPPFFHMYGFNGILNLALLHGCNVVSIPKFTPEDYIKSLLEYKPKVLFLVPSLMLFLATHPSVTKEMLKPVNEVLVGAAAATVQLQEKFRNKCSEDVDIRQGYGMTEASPCVLITPIKNNQSKASSSGKVIPNTEAKIVSISDGSAQGPNKTGELYVRGPQVMKGYLNNDEATSETLDENGWLKTGDIAYYDEDYYFYIVDRSKELIKVKGNQVSPTELENIILELDGIADVAVASINDITSGEIPRAYVVLKPNSKITEIDVRDHVERKCIKYKWLAGGVKFVKAVPRNQSGKILRKDLPSLDKNT